MANKSSRNGIRSLLLGITVLLLIIVLIGISVAILIKINKKDNSDSNNSDQSQAQTTPTLSSTQTSQTCPAIEKSKLPLASLPYAYDTYTWGTYRAPLYFGLRMRHEASPLFGLMWFQQRTANFTLHHYCEDDGVLCMWSQADGRSFGHQPIKGNDNLQFDTDWFNFNHSWTARINVRSYTPGSSYSFILYFALQVEPEFQDNNSTLQITEFSNASTTDQRLSISGNYYASGPFDMQMIAQTANANANIQSSLTSLRFSPFLDMGTVNGFMRSQLIPCSANADNLCLSPGNSSAQNFVAIQFTVQAETNMTINYRSLSDGLFSAPDFNTEFPKRVANFNTKFESIYHLQANNYTGAYAKMGGEAFANLIGSISFWTGYCQVASDCLPYDQAIDYGPLTLFSGIPSRPYYPRGFLWDEGFHNLLIRRFDAELTMNIMASWLDMMDTGGWIPREVVLDSEAHTRAPPLLFEDHAVANPPMFIYLMDKLLSDPQVIQQFGDRLRLIYPRLKQQYIWLRTIQKGPIIGSFQWQGRNATTNLELNPGSTPSGLDDYPRATHPTKDEYHLDIRCWMSMCSRVMKQYCRFVNDNDWLAEITADEALFNNLTELDRLHWSDAKGGGYFDYGLHSYNVTIGPHLQPDGNVLWYRDVNEAPMLRFVDDVYGYVNIFPMVLRLLPSDSPRLGTILRRLNDTNDMWTDFGLRSVSKLSRYYDAYNNEFAYPYWRGPIWININYLCLESLKFYSSGPGPYQQLSSELYTALRRNVVNNLANEYDRTGFIWEHYDDKTGRGAGTRPFTGWSSLVLGIMADIYD